MIRLLLTMVPQQRASVIRDPEEDYAQKLDLLSKVPF